jgi:hypothetical protein
MNSSANASLQASSTKALFVISSSCSHCVPTRPYPTLLNIVSLKRNGSCCTKPICALRNLRSISCKLWPPRLIEPLRGIRSLGSPQSSGSCTLSDKLVLIRLTGMVTFCLASRSYHRSNSPTMVLLPEPDAPTIAVSLPAGKRTLRSSRIQTWGLLGYAKVTDANSISPWAICGSLRPSVEGLGASMTAKKSAAAPAAFAMATIGAAVLPIDMTIIMTLIITLVLCQSKMHPFR